MIYEYRNAAGMVVLMLSLLLPSCASRSPSVAPTDADNDLYADQVNARHRSAYNRDMTEYLLSPSVLPVPQPPFQLVK